MEKSWRHWTRTSDWIGLVSFGFFLIALAVVWIITPNFSGEIVDFVNDFHLANVSGNVVFPAPQSPHPVLYTALMELCIIGGIFQIVILVFRIAYHEPIRKKADSISSIGFSFSIAFFFNWAANVTSASVGWFGLLAGLIVSIGLSIVLSSLTKLLR
ncbi:MAG: hypothetical protein QHH24_03075 [Candidatus Bathyarchaeota archaeon]|nr:hypothetical protein [Candidatus Bathyarchaeota archaeon]